MNDSNFSTSRIMFWKIEVGKSFETDFVMNEIGIGWLLRRSRRRNTIVMWIMIVPTLVTWSAVEASLRSALLRGLETAAVVWSRSASRSAKGEIPGSFRVTLDGDRLQSWILDAKCVASVVNALTIELLLRFHGLAHIFELNKSLDVGPALKNDNLVYKQLKFWKTFRKFKSEITKLEIH